MLSSLPFRNQKTTLLKEIMENLHIPYNDKNYKNLNRAINTAYHNTAFYNLKGNPLDNFINFKYANLI